MLCEGWRKELGRAPVYKALASATRSEATPSMPYQNSSPVSPSGEEISVAWLRMVILEAFFEAKGCRQAGKTMTMIEPHIIFVSAPGYVENASVNSALSTKASYL